MRIVSTVAMSIIPISMMTTGTAIAVNALHSALIRSDMPKSRRSNPLAETPVQLTYKRTSHFLNHVPTQDPVRRRAAARPHHCGRLPAPGTTVARERAALRTGPCNRLAPVRRHAAEQRAARARGQGSRQGASGSVHRAVHAEGDRRLL